MELDSSNVSEKGQGSMKVWRDLLIDLISRSSIARWPVPLRAFTALGLAYAIGVSGIHSAAQAQDVQVQGRDAHVQDATKRCNSECLVKQIDTLDQKVEALERMVDALTIETNKSIKTGQKIILRTDPGVPGGGCLTYIGPSGDRGGFVSWNVNCSHSASWVIR
jgi:hypothetical protein